MALGSLVCLSGQTVSANTTTVHEDLRLEKAKQTDLHDKKVKQAANEADWSKRKLQQEKDKANQHKVKLERARKALIEENKKQAIQSSIQKAKQSQESTTNPAKKVSNSNNRGVSKVSASQSSIASVRLSSQSSTTSQQSQSTNSNYSATEEKKPQSVAPQVTSGFNFLNHHYPIASFSGSGAVPANNYVYRWSAIPNYYLVERMGAAGAYINGLTVGSEVVIDGHTYHISQVLTGFKNTVDAASKIESTLNGRVGIQTCETSRYGGYATLTIWIAE